MPQPNPEFEMVKVQLLPVLHPRPIPPCYELMEDQIYVSLVLETGVNDVEVTDEQLDRWHVSFEEAMEYALQNLRGRSSPDNWEEVATVEGMQLYLPGNGDAASRALLLDELLRPRSIDGALFTIPSPNQLMVLPLTHFAHLESVQVLVTATAVAYQTATTPLSDQLFWFDGEDFLHIEVQQDDESVNVLTPPDLLQVIQRLTSTTLLPDVAEA